MADKLTYGMIESDGARDFGDVGFDTLKEALEVADDPQHALAICSSELDDYRDTWIDGFHSDLTDDDDIDPTEAFAAWKRGWLNAARARMKSMGVLPKRGIGRMPPQQWLSTRQQRAVAQWPQHGDEAFERETFVRDALKSAVPKGQREVLDADPSIVRSALDPALDFYATGHVTHYGRDKSVYVFTDNMFPDRLFRIGAAHLDTVRLALEQVTGTRWKVMPGPEERVVFVELAPITKRNPKSVMTSSSWSTARDKLRSAVATTKRNPDDDLDLITNPASAQLEEAKAKFEEFHRKKPTKIGEFHQNFVIPEQIGELGKAVHVLYRSMKKDPETGRQPKKPVDYIHEHYAGVKCYAVDDELEQCDVPDFVQEVDALVLLGFCLGFRYEDDEGDERDAQGSNPLPELYATPCGRALIVVQDKREVLAMIWGGGLGVWARGIDG